MAAIGVVCRVKCLDVILWIRQLDIEKRTRVIEKLGEIHEELKNRLKYHLIYNGKTYGYNSYDMEESMEMSYVINDNLLYNLVFNYLKTEGYSNSPNHNLVSRTNAS